MTKRDYPLAVPGIAAALMLLAALGSLPYGYYQFLRLVVCATGCLFSWAAHEERKIGLCLLFAVLALLFNPLVPVHLSRSTWAYIDIVAACLLMAGVVVIPATEWWDKSVEVRVKVARRCAYSFGPFGFLYIGWHYALVGVVASILTVVPIGMLLYLAGSSPFLIAFAIPIASVQKCKSLCDEWIPFFAARALNPFHSLCVAAIALADFPSGIILWATLICGPAVAIGRVLDGRISDGLIAIMVLAPLTMVVCLIAAELIARVPVAFASCTIAWRERNIIIPEEMPFDFPFGTFAPGNIREPLLEWIEFEGDENNPDLLRLKAFVLAKPLIRAAAICSQSIVDLKLNYSASDNDVHAETLVLYLLLVERIAKECLGDIDGEEFIVLLVQAVAFAAAEEVDELATEESVKELILGMVSRLVEQRNRYGQRAFWFYGSDQYRDQLAHTIPGAFASVIGVRHNDTWGRLDFVMKVRRITWVVLGRLGLEELLQGGKISQEELANRKSSPSEGPYPSMLIGRTLDFPSPSMATPQEPAKRRKRKVQSADEKSPASYVGPGAESQDEVYEADALRFDGPLFLMPKVPRKRKRKTRPPDEPAESSEPESAELPPDFSSLSMEVPPRSTQKKKRKAQPADEPAKPIPKPKPKANPDRWTKEDFE